MTIPSLRAYYLPVTTNAAHSLTQRDQAFALFLFQGKSQIASYHLANPKSEKWKPNSVYVKASLLANSDKIRQRLAELNATCQAPTIGDEKERKERLTDIYRANLVDFIDPDTGEPMLSRECPHHAAASEYTVSTRYTKLGETVVTKSIKLHPPVPSIAEQNKMERVGAVDNITNLNEIKILVVYEERKKLEVSE